MVAMLTTAYGQDHVYIVKTHHPYQDDLLMEFYRLSGVGGRLETQDGDDDVNESNGEIREVDIFEIPSNPTKVRYHSEFLTHQNHAIERVKHQLSQKEPIIPILVW